MADRLFEKPFEERLAAVSDWVGNLVDTGQVGELDSSLLRSVLVHFGADFEPKPGFESLSGYSNKAKRLGLDAVWGADKVDEYKEWIKEYVSEYERNTGRSLPVLEGTSIKTSGMMAFFGELTALAAGKMNFEKYKRLTEDRARKGQLWQEKDPNEPVIPSPHSSFPPGFPKAAWEQIKSWKRE